MDGTNLTSHPAPFASSGVRRALAATLEELQVAQASQLAQANQVAAPSAMPTQQAAPGVSARELLEELRTGRLAAERAFLDRARTALTENTPSVVPAQPALPPQPALPSQSALLAQAQVQQVFQEAKPEMAMPVAVAPAAEPLPNVNVEQEKHLIFALGELRYAVPLDHVIEIAELENHTPVPHVPEWILGITNLRGDILSLVDLNALFGESTGEVPRGSSLLVAQTNAGDLTTCLVVDRVYGVVNVTPDQVQKLDQVANHTLAQHTRGYVHHAGDLLSLLDLEGLLRALELHAAA